VRRVSGSNETPTTTITKYNPEDLRLSNCLWQLAVAKVKPFICSEFSRYCVVETGKTSELTIVRKLVTEDGKQALITTPICYFAWQLSQSTSKSFPNLLQSTLHLQVTRRASEISTKDSVSDCSTNRVHTRAEQESAKGLFMAMDCPEKRLVRSQPLISSVQ
jgi:hypothetical protein